MTLSSASRPSTTTARPAWCATARSSPPRRRSASRARSTTRGFPGSAVDYCLREGGIAARRISTTSCSTTSRCSSSSGCSRPTWRSRRAASRSFLHGDAGLAEGEAVLKRCCSDEFAALGEGCDARAAAASVHRAPRVARRVGVLSRRRSTRRPCSAWTASASGRRRSAWLGEGNELTPLWEIPFPHSLGLLYSAFTYYTGFKVNSGEYKLMGLAPYGEPEVRRG